MRTVASLPTLLLILTLLGVGLLTYQGWRYCAKHWHDPVGKAWRKALTVLALALVSLSAILFLSYGIHNAMMGGDRNGSALTVLIIKTGNSLSFLGILASLGGLGKGRWAALISGSFMLFLWFGQGMSL